MSRIRSSSAAVARTSPIAARIVRTGTGCRAVPGAGPGRSRRPRGQSRRPRRRGRDQPGPLLRRDGSWASVTRVSPAQPVLIDLHITYTRPAQGLRGARFRWCCENGPAAEAGGPLRGMARRCPARWARHRLGHAGAWPVRRSGPGVIRGRMRISGRAPPAACQRAGRRLRRARVPGATRSPGRRQDPANWPPRRSRPPDVVAQPGGWPPRSAATPTRRTAPRRPGRTGTPTPSPAVRPRARAAGMGLAETDQTSW